MNINATASSPSVQPMRSGGTQNNLKQLEQQKQMINEELEKVKTSDKIKPEEKEKRIEALEQKLKEIERQIQTLKQDANKVQDTRRDTADISPHGRAMSLIDNLMKQKEQINERKNDLISKTLEQGGDITSIERELDRYAEQLTSIDEQIHSALAKEIEQPKTNQKSEPKIEEENNSLSDIVNRSGDIKQMELIHAVKERVDGQINVLKSQVQSDQGATKERKLEQIAEMEERQRDDNHSYQEMNEYTRKY